MAMLTAAALAGSAVFGYNRENFQFDKKQTLEREGLRWGMQLKRFQLFRDDVRDLVNLTVDRMDVYHLIGALFMKFCIIVFCKGRIQASAPPFVLHLFQLSNACAFLYLLLAVWLSMHASIASHSFGVKMLTRFVRLPIPTQNQILTLKANLVDFEQQGVANMLRLPFQDHKDWEQVHGKTAGQAPQAPFSAGEKSMAAPPSAPAQSSSGQMTAPTDQVLQEPLRVAADAGATSHAFLEAKETQPFEDLLSGSRGAMPERHVQLFRNLQFKWQCYDAYCRVCLGLGLNHILQAMTYYCICHALVENQTPSLGLALVVLFQAATIFVAFLDLAGLQHREIITVQIVSIVPSIVTALEVSFSQRDKLGNLLPQQDYKLSPLSFLCHAMWLELWLRIAWPSGAEEKLAQLPRRFRQVLFLDPFGDALNWDPNQEAHGDARSWFEALNEEDVTSQAAAMHAAHEAACNATTQLTMAQCALRRWQSVPSWCSSAAQRKDLARLEERRLHWGGAIRTELERCGPLLPNLEGLLSAFEPQLRRWPQLSEEEKSSDPFAQCLLGPFEHDAGHGQMACYYYDLENERTQFSENSLGLLVLSLPAVAQILKDVETQVELLMELRILRDLSVAKTNQHVRARLRSQPSRPRGRRLKDRSKRFGKNLVGLFNQKRPAKHGESWSPIPHSSSEEALSPGGGNDNDASVGETPPQSAFVVESGDRTLRAMAGKHDRDFVPERLPWQILCRMTRVCQLTWAMCGVMVLLKELGLVQVDFQQGSARALAAEPLVLEEVRLDWPNGTLFLPAMLHCPASSVEPLLLASPTSLYLGSHLPQAEAVPVQFEFLAAVRLPQGATWLSTGEGRGHTGLERLALLAPGKSGLRLWSAGALLAGSEPHHIPLDGGADWRIVAAGLMPCVSLGNLLPDGSASEADLCIAVAGWDGEMLPIAVIPLCESCGILQSLRRAEVRPSVAAPLVLPEAAEGPEAMALSGAQLLVALSSRLKVWDLSQTRQLGEWTWAAAVSGFKTVGICILPDASCDAEQGPSSRCGLESAWLLLGHGPLGPSLHRASKQL